MRPDLRHEFRPNPKPEPKVKEPKGLQRRTELTKRPATPGGNSTLRHQAPASRRRGRRADEQRIRAFDEEMREQWKQAVCIDAGGRDQVTSEPLTHDWQAHHVIEQSVIYAMRRRLGLTLEQLAELLWDRRNGLAINKTTHERHDDGTNWTIPRDALRPWHWEYARDLDELLPGTQWATARLERDYPGERRRP